MTTLADGTFVPVFEFNPTIDRLAARGLLRPSRATRRPLYSVPEIERFLRETTAALTCRK